MVCYSHSAKYTFLHTVPKKNLIHQLVCQPPVTAICVGRLFLSLLEKNQGKLQCKHSPEKSPLMTLWDQASDILIAKPMHWNELKDWVISTKREKDLLE